MKLIQFLKNKYAGLCLDISIAGFNNTLDQDLDDRINKLLEIGLKPGSYTKIYIVQGNPDSTCKASVIAVDGINIIKYTFWNRNKYFAWLQEGKFEYFTYDTIHNKLILTDTYGIYYHKRPSAWTMWKFRQAIRKSREIEVNLIK